MDRNEKEIQCIGPKPFRKNKNKTNKKRKKKPTLFWKLKCVHFQIIHYAKIIRFQFLKK